MSETFQPLPEPPPPQPAINLPPVVVVTLVLLGAIHVIRLVIGAERDLWVILLFAFIPARITGADEGFLPGGFGADLWTFVTYAFLHGDPLHLLVNAFFLAAFGSVLARRFGALRFILFSLLAAVAGALLHLVTHLGDATAMIGASAAISAHMAAACRFIFIQPRLGEPTFIELDPMRRPAASLATTLTNPRVMTFLAVWFGANIVFGLLSGGEGPMSSAIAWQAHIGGFLFGLLAFPLFDPVKPPAPAAAPTPPPPG
jgi:membrane associated rhomboid family serine protease